LNELVAIPEQIVGFLAERLEDGLPAREPMLEVLARGNYRDTSCMICGRCSGRAAVRGV